MSIVLTSQLDWELIFLPDSQENETGISTETQWIADNWTAIHGKAVCHCGDLVPSLSNWTYADAGFAILDGASIPYAIAPGNHDVSGSFPDNGGAFGAVFGSDKRTPRLDARPYWDASFNADCLGSSVLFNAGTTKYLLLALMDQQSDGTALYDWAAARIAAYTDRKVIIVTHVWLKPDGDPWEPYSHPFWQTVVVGNERVFLVLSGHYTTAAGGGYEAHASTTVGSRKVHQVLANYQADEDDRQFLRLKFLLGSKRIYVRTYNPATSQYVAGPDKDYYLDISDVI